VVQGASLRQKESQYRGGEILAGKYELGTVLGEGAMAKCGLRPTRRWMFQLQSSSYAAVKALPPAARWQGHSKSSLLREAQATARVTHPTVVRIFDFGLTDLGDPFIVMEYLEGEELRTKLTRDGRMRPETAIQLFLPVMHGMQAAHVLGVVHRDLKPEKHLSRSQRRW